MLRIKYIGGRGLISWYESFHINHTRYQPFIPR